jgi:iron complex outermembrane recepter protein
MDASLANTLIQVARSSDSCSGKPLHEGNNEMPDIGKRNDAIHRCIARTRRVAMLLAILAVAVPAWPQQKPGDFTDRSLEDLMNMQVTSVSKKEEKLSRAAAAIFVITQEDIHRSGATNIPDLLRMVPGMQVAQINSSTWAISARGFDMQYQNKLLVLIDGRTVYSPVFSGVFWDAQEIPLETIERIEVIRGPGATVWGANAVNGVINIITKSAHDTKGALITSGGGTHDQGFGTAIYGGRIGNAGDYRVFASGLNEGHYPGPGGLSEQDDWDAFRGGFRADAALSSKDSFTLEGDVYEGTDSEMDSVPISISPPVTGILDLRNHFSGWDVLSRWNHTVSARSETSLQIYFDRTGRGDTTFGFGLNTFDMDFQNHLSWGDRQDLVWGLGYRLTSDENDTTLRIAFNPANRMTQLFSSFVQDEITIRPGSLYATLGVKLEHDDYNGFGWEPSARLVWNIGERNMLWTAVSRALRTPSRSDTAIRVNYAALPGPNNLPLLVSLFGHADAQDESLIAYEAGYRNQLTSRTSLDFTVFYSDYNKLVSVEPGASFLEADPAPLHLVVPSYFGNLVFGETHGAELSANWRLASRWTLSPGYAFLAMHLHRDAASQDTTTIAETQGSVPTHQAQLRSHVDLPWRLQWDTSAYFVGRLSAQSVPSYTRLDTNLTWQPFERFSIKLVGQNLLRDRHEEFNGADQTTLSSLIKRSAYIQLTERF